MLKHRKLLMAIGCTVAAGGLLGLLRPGEREPMYQGRSASGWFTVYYKSDRTGSNAQREIAVTAIKAMGTNAFPVLLRQIEYEIPSWCDTVGRRWPAGVAKRLLGSSLVRATVVRKLERAEAARTLLVQLGTNAVSTVPKLTIMIQDRNHAQTSIRAGCVLSYVGPEGFQTLVAALARTNQPFRQDVLSFIAFSAPVVGTNTCLPPLRAALEDPDPEVRITATNLVEYLTKHQESSSGTQ